MPLEPAGFVPGCGGRLRMIGRAAGCFVPGVIGGLSAGGLSGSSNDELVSELESGAAAGVETSGAATLEFVSADAASDAEEDDGAFDESGRENEMPTTTTPIAKLAAAPINARRAPRPPGRMIPV